MDVHFLVQYTFLMPTNAFKVSKNDLIDQITSVA